jgi:hypothetical protein
MIGNELNDKITLFIFIVLCAYIIEYIRPVCLPSWDDPDFANETVVVTGWTRSGIITLTLMPINHPL